MLKRALLLVFLIAMVATAASCIFNPEKPVIPPPPVDNQKFEDLTEKWHVLNNMELAYRKRKIERYSELLDNGFTFFLSAGDVGGGLPTSWDRETEVTANTNLINTEQPPAPIPRCKSIQMDIQWEDDKGNPALAWIEITPPNSTETWYTTTVFYDFQFDVEPDMTYINNPGAKAQFTVRNAGTEEAPKWLLVEFRDLGDPE